MPLRAQQQREGALLTGNSKLRNTKMAGRFAQCSVSYTFIYYLFWAQSILPIQYTTLLGFCQVFLYTLAYTKFTQYENRPHRHLEQRILFPPNAFYLFL